MRTYPWVKLYVEILHDPKMLRLSDAAYRFWIAILCMARSSSTPGVVAMTDEDIALHIHQPIAFVKSGLRACLAAGLVAMSAEGVVLPTFARRNVDRRHEEPGAVAARVRKHRARKAARRVTRVTKALPVTDVTHVTKRVTRVDVVTRCNTLEATSSESEDERTDDNGAWRTGLLGESSRTSEVYDRTSQASEVDDDATEPNASEYEQKGYGVTVRNGRNGGSR